MGISGAELGRVLLFIVPLAAGAISALLIQRWPHRTGGIALGFVLATAAIALSPFAVASADASSAPSGELLREAKLGIALGIAVLMGGIYSTKRARPPAA